MLAAERVVAVWIETVFTGAQRSVVHSHYMNMEELKYFLFSKAKGTGAGMLQQVIHMHGNKRRALRCHWSPHISTVEMYLNKKTITNAKIHINVRMADVHAGRGNTEITRLDLSTKLGRRIKNLSESVAARIEKIANTSRDGRLMIDPGKMNHPYNFPTHLPVSPRSSKAKQMSTASNACRQIDEEIAAMAALAGYDTVPPESPPEEGTPPPKKQENSDPLDTHEKQEKHHHQHDPPDPPEKDHPENDGGVYRNSLQKNYLDPFLRNATFNEKRNLLSVRLHSATFNFLIGEDNRTYLTFCNDVEMVDSQPAHQKRKKKSNTHTLEIQMLETATKNQHQKLKNTYTPMPSPILEKMGLGLLPTPEATFYKTYKDCNYEPEPDAGNTERDELAGTGFSVREMLNDGAEMLRAFFRRYAHHKTGALNLRAVFSSLDTSGDGQISSVEFRDLFREVNIHLTRTQLFAVIRLFDEDCDGRVSIDEFENWIMTEPVKRVDSVDHVALAIARENKSNPWGQSTTGATKKKYKERAHVAVDSVLFRQMRSVDASTARTLLNQEHAQAGAIMEARSKELAEAMAKVGKTEEEKRKEMLVAEVGDALGTGGLAKKGQCLPPSIERAYGKYRAHYMETVTIPLRGYQRSGGGGGGRSRHLQESPMVARRTVKPTVAVATVVGRELSFDKSKKIYGAKLSPRPPVAQRFS